MMSACFVLFWVILVDLSQEDPRICYQQPNFPRMRFSPSFWLTFSVKSSTSHLRDSRKKALWTVMLHRNFSQVHRTLLLRAGDVERNPGPSGDVCMTKKMDKKKILTVIHLNARSLLPHFDDIASLVSKYRPEILALSETWLDSSVTDSEINLPNYFLYRCDRSRSGGGVAVYCADHLSCSVLTCGVSASGVESLWVSIDSKLFSSPLALGCFYRPPSSPSVSVHDLCDDIETVMISRKYVIVCGDFNIDMSDLDKPYARLFHNFITSRSLTQPITLPTRYSKTSNSILDLFLASSDIPISNSSVLDSPISDHLPILLSVDCNVPKRPPSLVTRRSFKTFCKSSFEEDLATVPWSIINIFDNPDDQVSVFNTLFSEVLDRHAPIKTVRVKKNPAPWITKSIRDEMDRRNALFRLFRKNHLAVSWEAFKAQRNRVTGLQRKAKKEYFHRLLSKRVHPSTLWNTLKLAGASSTTSDNWSSFNTNSSSIANTLNTHFVAVSSSSSNTLLPPSPPHAPPPTSTLSLVPTTPAWCEDALASLKPTCSTGLDNIPPSALIAGRSTICYPLSTILNSSFASSLFPEPWKHAWVKPLHKGGDRTIPSNYRPISLLPACSKLLEKCVQQQLVSYLHSNDLLFHYQSGFRPSHSTQTLLLYCLDNWYKALDRKQYVGVVFLDISKAFDTVNHDLLLAKLSQLGLSPSTVSWFHSYLSNRSQVTRVCDSFSTSGFPTSGVPQGSVLGPTLFSTFINDLPAVLPSDSIVLFADDTAIYVISNNLTSLNSSLQLCLNLANLWMAKNGLKLNTSKTKCMLLHSSRRKLTPDTDLKLHIDGLTVEQVRIFKYLGVVINETLTWSDHIDMICSKVTRSLNLLRRLSWFLPRSLLLLYLKSYILPSFDYCDVVWSSCSQEESRRLETLFNFGCKVVLRRRRDYSSTAARKELDLTTLASRRQLHMAQCMFRCLSLQSPTYLSGLFTPPSSHYKTRSSSTSQLNLPLVRTSFSKKSFSFAGTSLWRSLPPYIRTTTDCLTFTKLTKAFIMKN